ncbi:FHA domain-containing protein FhaB/FipA [Microbacterium resistens]|uniref:FHA domain-containing protein FhaB/FipA n=1 Tax=Microbacterium resistens TaxID=156977 RepID=UPI00366B1744
MSNPSELTLLLLRIGFLVLLWFFVFAVVYSLRADLFGVRVRKMPDAQAAPATVRPPQGSSPDAATAPVEKPRAARSSKPGGPATTSTVSTLVITSGPKAGLELPLGREPMTIGRSSESGLVIRDDYTSSHHARLLLWGENWMIQDLDSTNGTFLGGERVGAPVAVTIGTPIKVGATTFELRA